MSLLNLILLLTLIVLVVAVGFILVPYFRQKGFLNDQTVNAIEQLVKFSQTIIQNLNTSDKIKDNATTVFHITQKVVQYIEQTMENDKSEDKKLHAIDVTVAILKSIGIDITQDIERLIEVGIESAVNAMNQNK